jgi:myo-inositol-1-phosphate synthase
MGLLELLHSRGATIEESYQLDIGGGTESINTLERTRETKRQIKTKAVASTIPYSFPLVSGSTDFVDFLKNSRDSFFWLKGKYFLGAPFTMDVKLNTLDSANGGAILFDTIRGLKIAKEKGLGGTINPVCNYGFKTGQRKSLANAVKELQEFALT